MSVGIGLPAAVPETDRTLVLDRERPLEPEPAYA
jgi:hypothetical protein